MLLRLICVDIYIYSMCVCVSSKVAEVQRNGKKSNECTCLRNNIKRANFPNKQIQHWFSFSRDSKCGRVWHCGGVQWKCNLSERNNGIFISSLLQQNRSAVKPQLPHAARIEATLEIHKRNSHCTAPDTSITQARRATAAPAILLETLIFTLSMNHNITATQWKVRW